MSIRYALYRNSFHRQNPDANYVARVHHTGVCDQKMLIELITTRNLAITPALAEAVLEEYTTALEYALASGMRVATPLLKIQASIQGTFPDWEQRRCPQEQPIVLKTLPGARLKKLIGRLKAERVPPKFPCPRPEHAEDIFSDTKDRQITPGGVLRLRGQRLKFNPEDIRQGVFLLPDEGEPIHLAMAITNIPTHLLLKVPDNLPAGEYLLEVRAIVGNSTEVRQGQLPYPLTVTQS